MDVPKPPEKSSTNWEILAWIAICVAMVGWIGFSAKIEAKKHLLTERLWMLAIDSYVQAFRLMQSK